MGEASLPNWRRPLLVLGLRLSKPASDRELKLLRRIEFSRVAMWSLHEQRLTALLRHAWATTDYYREILTEAGVVRDGVVDLAHFTDVPCLTKEIIRKEFDRLASRAVPRGRRVYANQSGGSTGEPTRFLQDSTYWDVNVATKLFHFGWFGKDLGGPELKIWGSEHDLLKSRESIGARLAGWLYNRRSEQCFSLSDERVAAIIERINSFRPSSIWAYRDGIDVIAQHILRNELVLHRPAALFLGGGTIYPHIVDRVERAFRAPVVNLYGGRETGDVACQCPDRRGLHIAMNAHRVEVVDREGRALPAGEEGELAITPLQNYAMPLIRYRVGDHAAALPASCPCGRVFPLLSPVSGRVIERLSNTRGDSIDPIFLIHIIGVVANRGYLRRFQVVQEAPDRLTINMNLESGVSPRSITDELRGIARQIRLLMGAECSVDFRFVDDIPLTRSGKYPYIVHREALEGPAIKAQASRSLASLRAVPSPQFVAAPSTPPRHGTTAR
jgi:phenylacetate-CoA ligase